MIGKQVKGRSFRHLLNYLETKQGAVLLGSNMGGSNALELAAEFESLQRLNPRVERVAYHASLSVAKDEQLDAYTWRRIGRDYLREMGFNSNQYCLYRHTDRDHDHVHLVASRIQFNGRCTSDSWDYIRSEKVIRKLEVDYGLKSASRGNPLRRSPTTGEWRYTERTGELSQREQIQDAVDEVSEVSLTSTDLAARLREQGITLGLCHDEAGKLTGVTYEKDGSYYSGTQLGAGYTLVGLQKYKGTSFDVSKEESMEKAQTEQEALVIAIAPLVGQYLELAQRQGIGEYGEGHAKVLVSFEDHDYELSYEVEEDGSKVYRLTDREERGELYKIVSEDGQISSVTSAQALNNTDLNVWQRLLEITQRSQPIYQQTAKVESEQFEPVPSYMEDAEIC